MALDTTLVKRRSGRRGSVVMLWAVFLLWGTPGRAEEPTERLDPATVSS